MTGTYIVLGADVLRMSNVIRITFDVVQDGRRGVLVQFVSGDVAWYADTVPGVAQLRHEFGFTDALPRRPFSGRATRVLALLAALPQGATHGELVVHLGFPKSTMSNLLQALVDAACVARASKTTPARYVITAAGQRALSGASEGDPA